MNRNIVKKYLIEARQRNKGKYSIGSYSCMEEFVLKNGARFDKTVDLPLDIKKGRIGNCFKNAFDIAQCNRRKYFYCEGYATTGKLVCSHAWVVNRKHEIIDPTWKDGIDYYGVIFRFPCVWHWMFKQAAYISIIDNWQAEWPLLKESRKKLKRSIIAPKGTLC